MKVVSFNRFICLLAIGFFSFTGCSILGEDPRKLDAESIEFSLPQPETWTLKNGLKVFYYHNDELPQVSATLYLPGGSMFEPLDKIGLASATGRQMRDGAVAGFTPESFDKHLDSLAASINSNFGREYGAVDFYCLEEDFAEVFSLFASVVRAPKFDAKRFALWKKLSAESIPRRRDNPETMAWMSFRSLVYGEDSNFYSSISYQTLKNISVRDLKAFHRRFVRPNGSRLAISGSLPKEVIERAIEKHFGDWPIAQDALPEIPEVKPRAPKGIYVLERELAQTTIVVGDRGPERFTKDLYDIAVFNRIFGQGGFSSTLWQEIRTRLGLAYIVYGSISPGLKAGTVQVYLKTRNDQVESALKAALDVVSTSKRELPDRVRFSEAKSAVERSFVFKFEEPDSIVDRAAMLELLGYPQDYDSSYLSRIEAVTAEKARAAADKWLRPEDAIVVVVGGVSAEKLAQEFSLPVYRLEFDTEPKVLKKLAAK